jgi:hypothetical protein
VISRAGPIKVGLRGPTDVLALADGGILISDTGHHRVLRVRTSRVVEVVAGTGDRGFAGDGHLAVAAELDSPTQLALQSPGSVLIADAGNGRIRRVTSGIIDTVVRRLKRPHGVIGLAGGDIAVADGSALLEVAPDGSRRRIAGGLEAGFNRDRGPARSVLLNAPRQLAVDRHGAIVFADRDNDRIRRYTSRAVLRGTRAVGKPRGRKSPTAATVTGTGTPMSASSQDDIPSGRWPSELDGTRLTGGAPDCQTDGGPFDPFWIEPSAGNLTGPPGTNLVLRYVTGRRARVILELYRVAKRVAKRDLLVVGKGRFKTPRFVLMRGDYVAKLWGRSGDLRRCDVRRLIVR